MNRMNAKDLLIKRISFFIFCLILSSKSQAGLFDSLLIDQSCPYQNTTLNCDSEQSKDSVQKVSQNSLRILQATCEQKNQTSFCQETFKRFPFLKGRERSCSVQGMCETYHMGSKAKALEGCQSGILAASKHLAQQAPQSLEEAQKMIGKFSQEMWEILKFLPQSSLLNWETLKNCFHQEGECSNPAIKKYLMELPAQAKNEVFAMLAEAEHFQCLDSVGRYELFCYQGVLTSAQIVNPINKINRVVRISKILPEVPAKAIHWVDRLKDTKVAKLEEKIGSKIEVVRDYSFDKNFPVYNIKESSKDQLIGTLDVVYNPSKDEIKMGHMYTHHDYREMGVGSALMENVLEDFPDVKVITSDSLVDMNRDIANKFINQGLSLKDSIKQTPAYKIREKFGYSEILPESIDPFMFSFSVKKPDLQSGRSH